MTVEPGWAPPGVDISAGARKALSQFVEGLPACKTADDVQNLVFDSAKKSGLKPGELFPVIYRILLGVERGPRLGPYVVDVGPTHVSTRIKDALAAST